MEVTDRLSGAEERMGEPNTIAMIEEAKIYRVAFTDGSGKSEIAICLRFPNDALFLVPNSRENIPLAPVNPWFKTSFLSAVNKKRKGE